jgi:hypothetical protein
MSDPEKVIETLQQRIARRMREEYAELEGQSLSARQFRLDNAWQRTLDARAAARRPNAISDYSPVERACRELDAKQQEADRAYTRGR